MNEKLDESSRHKLTKWYYLLPILLGIFGGILGYFWLLDVDKTKAENLGYVGYFLTILYFVVYISIFPLHA